VLFGYFLHDAKSDNPYSLAGSSEVLQTSNQHTKTTTSHNPIKSFFRLAAAFFRRQAAFNTFLSESFFPRFCEPQIRSPQKRLHGDISYTFILIIGV
jgi:hypothetical protein